MSLLGNVVDPEVITTSCFIPSISAVASGDVTDQQALHHPIAAGDSALDAFHCAGRNEGHTTMTEELGTWLVNEIAAEWPPGWAGRPDSRPRPPRLAPVPENPNESTLGDLATAAAGIR
ncbi:hypothetical protein [Streptomyces sp. NPDC088789]|uniref:hypothetical protein n=1 Tax=Streptomyces sp. NPDC088789 TaxID=3365899 RepID=UPI0037F7CCDC